jgi:hypothetical protein
MKHSDVSKTMPERNSNPLTQWLSQPTTSHAVTQHYSVKATDAYTLLNNVHYYNEQHVTNADVRSTYHTAAISLRNSPITQQRINNSWHFHKVRRRGLNLQLLINNSHVISQSEQKIAHTHVLRSRPPSLRSLWHVRLYIQSTKDVLNFSAPSIRPLKCPSCYRMNVLCKDESGKLKPLTETFSKRALRDFAYLVHFYYTYKPSTATLTLHHTAARSKLRLYFLAPYQLLASPTSCWPVDTHEMRCTTFSSTTELSGAID